MPPPFTSSSFFRSDNKQKSGTHFSSQNKPAPKRNSSILSFFKKSDTPPKPSQHRITEYGVKSVRHATGNGSGFEPVDASSELFFEDKTASSPTQYVHATSHKEDERYNEIFGSVKRRRTEVGVAAMEAEETFDAGDITGASGVAYQEELAADTPAKPEEKTSCRWKGPFLDESDSGDDPVTLPSPLQDKENNSSEEKEDGSLSDDFRDDSALPNDSGLSYHEAAVCPICRVELNGLTDTEASIHVNNCLDENPTTLESKPDDTHYISESAKVTSRIDRRAIPRPGQKNPFALDSKSSSTSAFAKIMSGNAEDTAWGVAAANEEASRGKQAYERTCPFYKILPGFSISVDAFRYGSIQGCNAYFLSHYHSDHYGGLTSSWSHGPIYCSRITANLVKQQIKVNPEMIFELEFEKRTEVPGTDRVHVTMIEANHCPGSSLFLFEKVMGKGKGERTHRILHCGDFRASPSHIQHPLLRPNAIHPDTGEPMQQKIDVCYLDTTYLNPKYAFPFQQDVVDACAELCVQLSENQPVAFDGTKGKQGGMITFLNNENDKNNNDTCTDQYNERDRGRLLVVIGTYSIGKERICLGIARALKCKIYASSNKQRICSCLEDEELSSLLTSDPMDAQVHMHSLMDMRSETLSEYLNTLKPHFSRIVGFRPTGWNYRPPAGRMTDSPAVSSVLHSKAWRPLFSVKDLAPQRGNNRESSCYSVPYSEHSSFRELTMFCCALRISRIIPTVNIGSPKSRERMKLWFEKWEMEKRKAGLYRVEEGATRW